MSNLKKTAAAVLALGLGGTVFAGTMGPVCTPGSVTVPCERTAWDFGARALYLNATGEDYFDSVTVNNNTVYGGVDHNWGWGFEIEGSYHFNTGNDFNINWYHFRKSHNRYFGLGTIVDPTLYLSYEPQWDAVNFEFGQHVDFGDQKNIRFHAGAQYARLKRESSLTVVGVGSFVNGDREFNGFGPRMGMDMSYDLVNGFSIYGKGAAAVLAGESKFSFVAGPGAAYVSGERDILVPEIEGKLGAAYTYAMAQGDLTLDVGYMWVQYINSHHAGFVSSQTNFGLDGILFGATWVGNVI